MIVKPFAGVTGIIEPYLPFSTFSFGLGNAAAVGLISDIVVLRGSYRGGCATYYDIPAAVRQGSGFFR